MIEEGGLSKWWLVGAELEHDAATLGWQRMGARDGGDLPSLGDFRACAIGSQGIITEWSSLDGLAQPIAFYRFSEQTPMLDRYHYKIPGHVRQLEIQIR